MWFWEVMVRDSSAARLQSNQLVLFLCWCASCDVVKHIVQPQPDLIFFEPAKTDDATFCRVLIYKPGVLPVYKSGIYYRKMLDRAQHSFLQLQIHIAIDEKAYSFRD